MKNILVIAQHHGVFLTLESIRKDKAVKKLIIVVPNSQLVKYSGFPDDLFKNYEDLLRAYVKKKFKGAELYVIDDGGAARQFDRPVRVLEELGETGNWLVLVAGAIYNKDAPWPNVSSKIGAVATRTFGGPNDMYAMIGLEPDTSMFKDVFFINMDATNKAVQRLPSKTIGRADALIGPALSAVECLRWSARCSTAVAFSLWMRGINKNLQQDEVVAYPIDLMLPYAKAVKDLIPENSLKTISDNAADAGWYADLRSTYL